MGVVELISFVLMTAGGFCVFVGGVGVLRMPDLYTRMHAASVTDTAGLFLVATGLMLHAGWSLPLFKLVAILVFLLVTSPTAAYALANAAMLSGHPPAGVRDETVPSAGRDGETP
tara:strand:+ start:1371 stop:1715 length:345 start_codon:yes stop_codon:yes gene_type:complete